MDRDGLSLALKKPLGRPLKADEATRKLLKADLTERAFLRLPRNRGRSTTLIASLRPESGCVGIDSNGKPHTNELFVHYCKHIINGEVCSIKENRRGVAEEWAPPD